jgi:hypothetical protein
MGRFLRKLDSLVFGAATLLVLFFSATFIYSLVEGYVDPVVSKLQIENPRVGPNEFDVTFDGQAEKLRNCTWIESRWYIGERFELSVRTNWLFAGPPQVRTGGTLVWRDQVVSMTPQELYHNSHADVVHTCPWRLWNVVTPLYDSNDDVPVPQLGPPVVSPLEQQIQSLRKELEQLK